MSTIYSPNTNNITINTTGTSSSVPYTVTGYNGVSGATLATTMSGTTSWVQPKHNFVSNAGTTLMSVPHNSNEVVLEKAATLDVQGTVKINGQDLEERLSTIEKVLQIPTRDVTMEAKHPKLTELYNAYMHELEKYKTWDRLNGDKNVT